MALDLRAGSRREAELEIDGTAHRTSATGTVDATLNAIRAAFPHEASLVLFSVGAGTEDTDAQA